MKHAFRSFIRNRKVTLTAAAAVGALVFFLMAYVSSIGLNRQELLHAYDSLEVTATIEGASASENPILPEQTYQAILETGYVRSHSASAEYVSDPETYLRAVTDISMDAILETFLPSAVWNPGYDGTGFLNDSAPVCIISESYRQELETDAKYQRRKAHKDDPTWVEAEQPDIDVMENLWIAFRLGGDAKIALQAVGVYGDGSEKGSILEPNYFYVPIPALKEQCRQNGVDFVYSGMRMEITDLEHLEDFKAQMMKLGLNEGDAVLVMNDSLLRQTASQLKRQIRLMESVLPILLILVAGIGFGLSFLLLRGRRREAAVMRSLGMKRGSVFGTLLLESGMQAVLGGLLGAGLTVLILGKTAFQPVYFAQLLGFYLLGGAAAVWKISGANVFTTMRE